MIERGEIRQLAAEVADAIAAGEVVERPASVVKELLENALDAGAKSVFIDIRGAGRTLVRVADDGAGIPPEQLAMAFRRHATSKVARLSDLEAIASFGFRGEALASIAAVAAVECSSRGRRIRLRAGQVLEEGAGAPTPGTLIEVRDLFGNTPARLKFLKSDTTEVSACVRVAQAYALLQPGVRLRVTVDGRDVLSTPGDGRRPAAAAAVYGAAVARQLLELESGEVAGLVSPAQLSRGNRDGILLAVNGRPVSSRPLQFAVEECYRGALERGRFPVVVLDVAIPPGEVDVNVHPAKREVRFRQEGAVFAAVQKAILGRLGHAPVPRVRDVAAAGPAQPVLGHATVRDPGPPLVAAPTASPAADLLRPLGQVASGYLVAEGPDGLVLVDQHAAHERVLFNRFVAQLEGAAQAAGQPLLLPVAVELEPAQAAAVEGHGEELGRLGFVVEPFGPRLVRILSGPLSTPPAMLEPALRDVLDGLARRSREDALASLACHSAVRFGDQLDPAEQRRLLEDLAVTAPNATCPHGRPTRLQLDWQELKRRFRRNY